MQLQVKLKNLEGKQLIRGDKGFEDLIDGFVSEKDDMDYKNTLYKAILIVLKDLKGTTVTHNDTPNT